MVQSESTAIDVEPEEGVQCSAVGITDLTGEGAKVIERKTSALSMLYLELLKEI